MTPIARIRVLQSSWRRRTLHNPNSRIGEEEDMKKCEWCGAESPEGVMRLFARLLFCAQTKKKDCLLRWKTSQLIERGTFNGS